METARFVAPQLLVLIEDPEWPTLYAEAVLGEAEATSQRMALLEMLLVLADVAKVRLVWLHAVPSSAHFPLHGAYDGSPLSSPEGGAELVWGKPAGSDGGGGDATAKASYSEAVDITAIAASYVDLCKGASETSAHGSMVGPSVPVEWGGFGGMWMASAARDRPQVLETYLDSKQVDDGSASDSGASSADEAAKSASGGSRTHHVTVEWVRGTTVVPLPAS